MRPQSRRPESVRPHLEPLSAPEEKGDTAQEDLAEDKDKKEQEEEPEAIVVQEQDTGAERECHRPKVRTAPEEPSAKEREEHEMTHTPYRSWCEDGIS